jgi:DNA-binding transcriptional LysR family regulator
MPRPDLNLLFTLDVLLAEGSVAGAARRLRLSPSAMSRALARLRETTGDPLLVRAGRGLVPTPRAIELRERVGQLVQDGEAVLRPAEKLNLKQLVRTFTLRSSEGFVENFGPDLIARVGEEAPGVRLCFVQKPDKDSKPLRDGLVDLETGVVGQMTAPELRMQALFRDRFIGVVRMGHPLSQGVVTPSRYAAGRHVYVSRQGVDKGPIDLWPAADPHHPRPTDCFPERSGRSPEDSDIPSRMAAYRWWLQVQVGVGERSPPTTAPSYRLLPTDPRHSATGVTA